MMKITKRFLFLIVFTLFFCNIAKVGSSAGQTPDATNEERPIDETYFLQFMEALKNRDADTLFGLWAGERTREYTDYFEYDFNFWKGREMTSYKKLGEEIRPENKEKKIPPGMTYEYELASGDDLFRFIFTITDDRGDGQYIDSYQFYDNSKPTVPANGWNQIKLIKWGLVALRIIEISFSVLVCYWCVKEKPRLWAGWVFLILLVYGGISLRVDTGVKLGAFIYILRGSEIFISPKGFQVYLSLPIGAVAYFIRRRRMKKQINEPKEQTWTDTDTY